MASEQSNILKRQEQLIKWSESETERASSLVKEAQKIRFSEEVQFLSACNSNDWQEIERLLGRGININCTQDDGLTSLHQACIDDDENLVHFLINKGAEIDAQDKEGWTPLFAAISCNYLPIIKYLISCGARLDMVSFDGELPLDQSNSESISSFIKEEMRKRNLNPDEIRNRERNAMLHDIDVMKNTQDFSKFTLADNGGSLLHVAASKDYTDVLEKLLQIITPEQLNHTDKDGWNALHVAAHWGNKRACLLLVDADINFDQVTVNNQTVLEVSDDNAKPYIREEIRKARFRRPEGASVKRPAESPNIEFHPSETKIPCQDNSFSSIDKTQQKPDDDTQVKVSNNDPQPVLIIENDRPVPTMDVEVQQENVPALDIKIETTDSEKMVVTPSTDSDIIRSKSISNIPDDNSNKSLKSEDKKNMEINVIKPTSITTEVLPSVKAIESESQRKDKARHVRSVRRSTQGVTAEEIDEARKLMSGDKVSSLDKTSAILQPERNNPEVNLTVINENANKETNIERNIELPKEIPSITKTERSVTVDLTSDLLKNIKPETQKLNISVSVQESLDQNEQKKKTGSHLVNKRKTRERLPTGIVDEKDIQAARYELRQADQQEKPQIDYKTLYENELKEKEKLHRSLVRLRRDLDQSEDKIKNLQNNHVLKSQTPQISTIMPSKCDIITIDRLREENKKMKEANSALIRVISRLSHPSSNSLSASS